MPMRKAHGRRRAVPVQTSALAALSKSVADNAGGVSRKAAVIAAASGLVLTSGIAAAQAADAPVQRDAEPASTLEVVSQAQAPLSADATVQISYERPVVETTPAPVVEAPKPVVAVPATTAPAAAKAAAPAKAQVTVTPAAAAPAAAPAAGAINATMVSSAYAQIGMIQDCTRLVENALNAAGIRVGDLGPMQFMNYGTVVSEPQPGDMVVQPGHVGIYVGNGQVLSSGLNGKNETAVHPLTWMTSKGAVSFVRAG
ncbi:NlpC/P60 family protein (plasmid) [Pseudarthrobacter phenanthrenivorans Sphe3]|uniref:NlpC/P60 family protein n=1 Tax=Pseudarthrobacter phenanthrenivorans (strain DSM 18606 / JCM 16027 / LMG 23796 / Sphe3) TaxID=930171 RepID=F0MCB3_PSEPM|nr:NlpC/P60 family protein [Pseudarthrobacter phenanthrenivorans]ADX75164.1 NlpC/P60 family protein [Pseudarthrobacter phenanthrenivorans Sphe3]